MADKQKIPIVIAVDTSTVIPMFVTIGSAFESAEPDTVYAVHILSSEEFSGENKNRLEELKQTYKNHDITIHISSEVPFADIFEILPDTEKCIWLSPCMVVNNDLTELFNIELNNNYIAGVRDAFYCWPEDRAKDYCARLGIRSTDFIINPDVLLLNVKEMRNSNFTGEFQKLENNDDNLSLQDLLNKCCYKKIQTLPLMYNLMSGFHPFAENAYEQNKALQFTYSLKEWHEACNSPIVLNFNETLKPWDDFRADNAKIWWQSASRLPFFGEIFNTCADNLFACINERDPFVEQLIREREESARNDEAQKIKDTVTFKTGEAIVYIPRKIKGFLKR